MNKILNLEKLKAQVKKEKNKNKKIVLCHGVFDLIHIGHIKHFKEARKNGDYLIVSITSDKFVNKGSGRPIFNQSFRAEFLSSLSSVDAVFINDHPTSEKLISNIKPNIYFKGPDYKDNKKDSTKNIYKEIANTKRYGGKVVYSDDITFSSSNLINTHSNYFNKEQKIFIKKISKKYSFNYIEKKINELKKLKVLLVGETIIDQYIFGDVLGKSGKEPHLVLNEKLQETYLGGATAIAPASEPKNKDKSPGSLIFIHKEITASIVSPAPTLSTSLFAKAGAIKVSPLSSINIAPLLPLVIISFFTLKNLISSRPIFSIFPTLSRIS